MNYKPTTVLLGEPLKHLEIHFPFICHKYHNAGIVAMMEIWTKKYLIILRLSITVSSTCCVSNEDCFVFQVFKSFFTPCLIKTLPSLTLWPEKKFSTNRRKGKVEILIVFRCHDYGKQIARVETWFGGRVSEIIVFVWFYPTWLFDWNNISHCSLDVDRGVC